MMGGFHDLVEIRKRLEGLTPIQKKAALDLLDTYISNLPYLTNEE